jgi:hypothetical protein
MKISTLGEGTNEIKRIRRIHLMKLSSFENESDGR